VVRQAASRGYGDGIMSTLARLFAFGGPVRQLGPEDFKKAHQLKVEAETAFQNILDRATGLPHSSIRGSSFGAPGQDVSDYVARVLELIRASNNPDEIQAFMDRVLGYYNAFDPAIEDAKKFNVPLVLGAFSDGGSGPTQDSQLFKDASQRLIGRRFAGGGNVDTIPAMLTPGEYVVKPSAAQSLARMFGGGFLPALNEGAIPKINLERMLNLGPETPRTPRIARFADGGYVGNAPGGSRAVGGSAGAGGGDHIEVHLHGIRDDEDYVRTRLIPTLDKIQKRSFKK
jgi:hypothetical protein